MIKKKEGGSLRFLSSKKGQVTIFVILAVIIVAVAALVYFLYPSIKSAVSSPSDPTYFIQTCMNDQVKEVVNNLSLQGGDVSPDFYYTYQGNKIQYLCYTNQYYIPCIVQQPMLISHIESEIKNNIQQTTNTCFSELKKNYESKGYTVNLNEGSTTVELLPQTILITFNNGVTITKGKSSQNYKRFSIVLNNNLYELASIANSIISWEATYGDAETSLYMSYYHNLEVEKKTQDDGTKIYILTDLESGNKFQFATRSLAWPPGYGYNQTVSPP